MSEEQVHKPAGPLRWLCWLPLACLLVTEVYIRNFDGWGAWAAAPLLLLPALVGLALAIAGLQDCVAAARSGGPLRSALAFTLVAALPLFWLAVRRFVV